MKTIKALTVTGLASTAFLVAPLTGWAQVQPAATEQKPVEEHTELISGIVKKKDAEKKLMVLNTVNGDATVAVNDRTAYKKGGSPAKAEDVEVGARVIAKAKKIQDGTFEAIEVRILGAESTPESPATPDVPGAPQR
jgi:hypothetical protein